MKANLISANNNWLEIKNATLNTIAKESNQEPTSEWKRRLLLSEHSPIRKLNISWRWTDLMYWVSVHLVRHKFGIEHFVSTQRTDRTGTDRNSEPQSASVRHECVANAQAIINISRKRLCNCASPETREAWKAFLETIKDVEPELYSCCVPDCVYRGWCYEYKSCGYHKTDSYRKTIEQYRSKINI